MSAARTFGWSSQARAGWPSFRSVVPVDCVVAVGAIALAAFSVVGVAVEPVDKAAFSEALHWAALQRIEVVEHLAVHGRPLATDVAATPGSREAAGPEYERHLSGAFAALTAVAAQPGKADDRGGPRFRSGVVEGSIVTVGHLRAGEGGFMLPLMPALSPPESAAVIEWVCGEAPVPNGRTIPEPRPATRVPDRLMPSVCRKGALR